MDKDFISENLERIYESYDSVLLEGLKKKAFDAGLPNLVEGALGGYGSFRVEKDGKIEDIAEITKTDKKNTLCKSITIKNIIEQDIYLAHITIKHMIQPTFCIFSLPFHTRPST